MTLPVEVNPLLLGANQGYQISRSVRLRSSASAYFNRTFSASGTTATFSFWVKRGLLGFMQSTFDWSNLTNTSYGIEFTAADTLDFYSFTTAYVMRLVTTQVFRDPSAWYHIVCVQDTTQAIAANRIRIYINGVQVTAFGTATYPAQNTSLNLALSNPWNIGRAGAATSHLDGYITEFNFIDGQALTAASFGEFNSITGVWQPKKYTGTYGTNGFYLNFSDNSAATAAAIGKDYSGNGNNWTPNNISLTAGAAYDSMLDVPTMWADGGNGRGNYATLNPLQASISNTTISAANLQVTLGVSGQWRTITNTIPISSGKWYVEATVVTATTAGDLICGIVGTSNVISGTWYIGQTANSYGYIGNGQKANNTVLTSYGATYTTGDVIGIAFDADADTLTFYKNNVSQGTAFTGITGEYYFAVSGASTTPTWAINFGQRPFAYTPPTGFKALNTQNLPDALVKKGNQYFDATTYTGNGSSQSITNTAGFQPDLVWAKGRSGATDNAIYDSIRGATNDLVTNSSAAATTQATGLTSFNSTGFSIGALAKLNTNLATYVGWQWKAGGTAVTNTAGSITSQVSANVSAGISVVTYTGTGANATVGHGLGVAPKMVIVKGRNSVNNWTIYHARLTSASYCIFLDLTDAQLNNATVWQATNPTSSVFSVGTSGAVNNNTTNFVAYCFAEVAGFSKFGSYVGNGSADGPFVYCGFRPAFVMVKRADAVSNWLMFDDARVGYNVDNKTLYASLANAEATDNAIDLLSNGFKMRSATIGNVSLGNYIFLAFAENPFKNALAR